MNDLFSAILSEAIIVLLIIGAVLGLSVAGLIWLAYYLCHHLTIGWKS